MYKKCIKLLTISFIILILGLYNSATFVSAEESGCVSCHTSLKKLLKVTRDIEAAKPEVEEAVESEGEG